MKIDKEFIKKIADLAHIKLDEKQVEHYIPQLSRILSYLEKIAELEAYADEDGWREPAIEAGPERDDELLAKQPIEEFLSQAPKRSGTSFKVPRIID